MTMALAAPTPLRKQDIRGELADARIELHARRSHELVFIRRIRSDASAVIRLLTNEQIPEACSVLGGMLHASGRRLEQLAVPDDGSDSAA